MPASMMSAETGATLKVIGSSMAIVASGPIPGSTPISVPRKTPMKQNHRFWNVRATEKPRTRLLKSSMSVPREERIGESQSVDEDAGAHDRESCRQRGHFPELEFVAGKRRGDDERKERRNESDCLHHHAEYDARDRKNDERAR